MPDLIIGAQPCRVICHHHTAILQCLCQPEPLVILTIVGWGPVTCPKCHKTYTALGLNPDGSLMLTMTPATNLV